MIYRIKSMSYPDYLLVGPAIVDLSDLEEEWVNSEEPGTAREFVLWLIKNKKFHPVQAKVTYEFTPKK